MGASAGTDPANPPTSLVRWVGSISWWIGLGRLKKSDPYQSLVDHTGKLYKMDKTDLEAISCANSNSDEIYMASVFSLGPQSEAH